MNEIVNTQTLLFIRAIEIGILFGMVYDLVRIFRKIIPHPNWLVQLEDSLYWLACMFIGFSILYIHNFAEIRLFVFLGMILGGILYLATFSIVFMKIATWIIEWMRRIIKAIIEAVLVPIRWLIGLIKIPLRFISRQYIRANTYRRKQVKKAGRKWQYIKADMKTEIKVNSNKNIYNNKKTD
ncbi:MAG: spore cortex biosynthesis protein YabQ [Cellulosilyticaceae bacterium]